MSLLKKGVRRFSVLLPALSTPTQWGWSHWSEQMSGNNLPAPEHFLAFALRWLRDDVDKSRDGDRKCDFYAETVAWDWCLQQEETQDPKRRDALIPVAIETAWELVRRGILRPGGRSFSDMNASDPSRFCSRYRP